MGKNLYKKHDSWYFKKKHLQKAEQYYHKKGKTAIITGKFIPVIRTFNPILSGICNINLPLYLIFTSIGTALWICTLVLGAYFIGKKFPELQNYIHLIIPGIILLSLIPLVINYFQKEKNPTG